MRIAILTNTFPPDGRGGAERIAWLQAEDLALKGHEVMIWAAGQGVGGKENGVGSHINVRRFLSSFCKLGSMNVFSRLAFHIKDLFARKNIVREIAYWKPDVLITHNLTGCGIATGRRAQGAGARWLHILHDVQLTEPSGQITERQVSAPLWRLWRFCWAMKRRYMFGTPDVLVSPSQWLLDWHKRYGFGGKQEAVLPNPVEMGETRERTLKKPATIAYVGRLSEDKGFADFLDLIPKLDPALVGSIVIAGDGPLHAAIGTDHRISYRGQLSSDETRKVIADADLVVAPSRILENQPTVILEAMAEGTPVVASDSGGTAELLLGTGSPVVSFGERYQERLLKAITVILTDEKMWQKVSTSMRERAGRHNTVYYLDALLGLIAD